MLALREGTEPRKTNCDFCGDRSLGNGGTIDDDDEDDEAFLRHWNRLNCDVNEGGIGNNDD